MKRREFPKSVKLAAFQRCKGICECGCGVKIIAGDGPEYDHRIEDALGGEPMLENCVVLRKRCHKSKTRSRTPALTKARAVSEKAIGARASKSRPMPGTKASGWKKKMDGSVERR